MNDTGSPTSFEIIGLKDEISRLKTEVELLKACLHDTEHSLAHSRKVFNHSSEAARIGVWECSLPGEVLTWTNVVYDIFDLPRGSAIVRNETVSCYTKFSADELQMKRSSAIANRGGFSMDAEIISFKGIKRWIRITATVECENAVPVRIFGMKQDITEQKLLLSRTKYLAEHDMMTGLPNHTQFQIKLKTMCEASVDGKYSGALLLIDLDGFKQVNDSMGHATGDEALKEVAHRINVVCQKAELVARIGGDEFAVLVGQQFDKAAIASLADEIVQAARLSKTAFGFSVMLGASIGISSIRNNSAAEVFNMADSALYAAKRAGRNTYRICETNVDQS